MEILNRVFSETERRRDDPFCRYVAARIALQCGQPARAEELLQQIDGEVWVPGFRSSRLSLQLQAKSTADPGDPELPDAFDAALRFAHDQQAWFWWKCIRLTRALTSPSVDLTSYVRALEAADTAYLSIQAELVVRRLADLEELGFERVRVEASTRPVRWRWALRGFLLAGGTRPLDVKRAAELLEVVGDLEDVARLVSLRKRKALRLPDAGRALLRRLAPRVYVEDLGRVSCDWRPNRARHGHPQEGSLAALLPLDQAPIHRHPRAGLRGTLARDGPRGGGKFPESVGVFPSADYRARLRGRHERRLSPKPSGLDMVRQRSRQAAAAPTVSELIGRDASRPRSRPRNPPCRVVHRPFRGRLHIRRLGIVVPGHAPCGFLDRIERAVDLDTRAGAFDRALTVAQLALQADPDAEQIELCLLRLYRRTGATAAAAEQYSHYASVMRDQLGLEPPPLESI